ncbi:hypothetical protein RHSIM_Rhsim03G0193400 [Rhododendron simsii]|uniref:Glycosyltransferase n=1 Tax=Rhododendron simsii TaxID=118357 RepID=A0A834H4P0_RHOSS|nr:hypothetical protein RHSIM_Rhsim03G0193100 [Rhododendron simsii]KAF7147995.1 hypothetical protein RHSIM_Rhsim03G0193400 [Rhododendron simsii]
MEDTIILYPSPVMGHLVPMVELGKLILTYNPSFSIIILITTTPFDTGSISSYIKHVTVTTPSVHFHHLSTISPPSTTSSDNIATLAFELPQLYNSNLHHALQTMISQKSRPKASIIDLICNSSFEVFTSLDIPTYYFCTSSASSLSALLSLPKTHQILLEKNKDPNTSIEFPGVPPIPIPDLPGPFLDTEGIAYKSLFGTAINMVKSAGILTNTCHAFEPRAVKAISDGLCTPNLPTPPVNYYIGPIVANSSEDHEHECLRWLDSQPSRSVVFLCFGSMGLFKAEQLTEMAIGLEKSGHGFLWVVRSPPADGETKSILTEPDLDVLLPNGFLDRTRGRGLVVKKWAPQVAVLSHDSVGGFVTHCGWNSILEAVSAGVPMVAWPLYAEQRFNRVLLVEEMRWLWRWKSPKAGL